MVMSFVCCCELTRAYKPTLRVSSIVLSPPCDVGCQSRLLILQCRRVAQFRRFVDDAVYKTDAECVGEGGHGIDPSTGKWEKKPECS